MQRVRADGDLLLHGRISDSVFLYEYQILRRPKATDSHIAHLERRNTSSSSAALPRPVCTDRIAHDMASIRLVALLVLLSALAGVLAHPKVAETRTPQVPGAEAPSEAHSVPLDTGNLTTYVQSGKGVAWVDLTGALRAGDAAAGRATGRARPVPSLAPDESPNGAAAGRIVSCYAAL